MPSNKIQISENELFPEKSATSAQQSPTISISVNEVQESLDVPSPANKKRPCSSAITWVSIRRSPHFVWAVALMMMGIFGTLIVFSQTSSPEAETLEKRLAQEAEKGVVRIFANSPAEGVVDWVVRGDEAGSGSGVVIARQGNRCLILTNRHVVTDSRGHSVPELFVMTKKEKVVQAKIVGFPKDGDIDLALVVAGNLPELSPVWNVAKLSRLKQGEHVVAIGHPLEFDFTITNGICSAIRNGFYIQHSAPINPGNSGGPLFNARGEIVGINTLTLNNAQGIFIAFPADYVARKTAWEYHENITPLLNRIKIK